MSKRLRVLLRAVVFLAAASSSTISFGATVTWDAGGPDDNWSTAANWTGDSVPAPGDDVIITTASGVVYVNTSQTANSVTVQAGAALALQTGGVLTVNGATTVASTGSIQLDDATFTGNGTLTVDGDLFVNGSTLSGSGALILNSTATMTIASNPNVAVISRSITNAGTILFHSTSAVTTTFSGATLTNTGIIDIQNAWDINPGLGTPVLNNNSGGLIRKKISGGPMGINFPVNNAAGATIEAQTGHFYLNGGGSVSGTWSILAGSQIRLGPAANTVTMSGSPTVSGAGTLYIDGATLSAGSGVDVTIPNLTLNSGSITGAGAVRVSGDFAWFGGTIAGAGTRVLESTSTPTITCGTGSCTLSGAALQLQASATFSASINQLVFSSGASLTIDAGKTLTITNAGGFVAGVGGGSVVNNGTIRKNSFIGASTIGVPVTLSATSTVDIDIGTLQFGDGATVAAGSTLDITATLAVTGGEFVFNSGPVTMPGSGSFLVSSGTLRVPTAVTMTVPNVNLQGTGIIDGGGTLILTGTSTWSGGTMGSVSASGGITQIDSGQTLNVTALGVSTLTQNRIVRNNGTLNLPDSGTISLTGSATIENNGTIAKNGGAATVTINPRVENNNGATLSAAAGTVALSGGGIAAGAYSISGGATLSLAGGTFTLANTATVTGTLSIAGGTLDSGPGIDVTIPNLTLSSGSITGAGAVRMSGNFTWAGGTIAGSGPRVLNATSVPTFTCSVGNCALNGATLQLQAFTIYSGSTNSLVFSNGASLTLDAAVGLRVTADGDFVNGGGVASSIVIGGYNSGYAAIWKTTTSGTSTIGVPVTISGGAFNVDTGTLQLAANVTVNAGTPVPVIDYDPGSTIEVTGGVFLFNASSSLPLSGDFKVNGGTLRVATGVTITMPNLTLQGSGVVDGGGTLILSGTSSWTGGTMGSAAAPGGITQVGSGNTLTVSGSPTLTQNRIVRNNGTLNLPASGAISLTGSATIENNATIAKNAGAGTFTLNPAVENNNGGTISAAAGTIALSGGGVAAGAYSVSAGATLSLAGGTFNAASTATATGAGTFSVAGGTLASGPGVDVTFANLTLASGTITGTGAVRASGNFTWSGGTITGSGPRVLNGTSVPAISCSSANCQLDGATLQLQAWGTYSASTNSLVLSNGASLVLDPGQVLFVNNNGDFVDGGGAASSIVIGGPSGINGCIEKTTTAGTSTIGVPVTMAGSFKVVAGTLQAAAGVTAAAGAIVHVDPGTTVEVTGGVFLFNSGSVSFPAGGSFKVSAGTMRVPTGVTLTVPNLILEGSGVVDGGGTLTLTGTSTWAGGTMGSASASGGVTQIGSTLNATAAGATTLTQNRILRNNGTLNLPASGAINLTGSATIENNGTIAKNSGAGTATIHPPVENNNGGTISVASGTIALAGGGTAAGAYATSAGATLTLTGGTVNVANTATATGTGTFSIAGATFDAGAGVDVTFAGLTLASGTITGAGAVRASGAFTWSGGTITGSGPRVLNATSTPTISCSAGNCLLNGATLQVQASATYGASSNALVLSNGASLSIDPAKTFSITSDGDIQQGGGAAGSIANNGTIAKTTTSGTSTIGVPVTMAGSLDIDTGTLQLAGGATVNAGATLDYAAATTLEVTGGVVLFNSGSVSLLGSGSFNVSSGTLRVPTGVTLTMPNMTLQGSSVIDGGGTLILSGTSTWAGGTMGSATAPGGITQIDSGNTLNVTAAAPSSLTQNRILRNNGTLNLPASGAIALTGSATIENNGTIAKNAGLGTATIHPPVENNNGATISVAAGTVALSGGGLAAGAYAISAGAALTLASGTFNAANTATVTGAGTFSVAGGTLDAGAGVDVTFAGLTLASGTITGPGAVRASGAFTWSGGTIAGSGPRVLNTTSTPTFSCTAGNCLLNGATLQVQASATYSASSNSLVLSNGASLVVDAGKTLTITNDGDVSSGGGAASSIISNGTIAKTTTSGTSTIAVPVTMAGAFDLDTGTLQLAGGVTVNAGAIIDYATGSVLEVTGGVFLLSSGPVSLPGSGTFNVSGGTLRVPASVTVTVPGVTLQGSGVVDGGGTLILSGTSQWHGGTMGSATAPGGITQVDSGATLSVNAVTPKSLAQGRELLNNGTVTYAAFPPNQLTMSGNSTFTNNAALNLNATLSLSGTATIANNGTITKTAASVNAIEPALDNNAGGTVSVTAGTLVLSGGGTERGAFTIASGAKLVLGPGTGTFTMLGSPTVGGAGIFEITRPVDVGNGPGGAADTLTVSAPFDLLGTLNLKDATLQASSAIAVSGTIEHFGGAIAGSGTMTVSSGGAVKSRATDSASAIAINTTIDSGGSLEVIGNVFQHALSGSITVTNNGTIDFQGDGGLANAGGAPQLVNNTGTLTKSAGSGTTAIDLSVASNAGSTVQAAAGTLAFNQGGTFTGVTVSGAGTVALPAAATVSGTTALTGRLRLTGNASLSGTLNAAGTLLLDNGVSVTWPNVNLSAVGSKIDGAGTLHVSGNFTWAGGTITGSGPRILTGASTPSIGCGAGNCLLDGATLQLQATATTYSANVNALVLSNGASLIVDAGKTLDITSDGSFTNGGGAFGSILNNGTIRKSTTAGASLIAVPMVMGGGLDVDAGTLQLAGDVTVNAGAVVDVGAGASIDLLGGVFLLNSGSVSFPSPGAFKVTSAALRVPTGVSATVPNLTLQGGTLDGGGTLILSGTSSWASGTMGGAAPAGITRVGSGSTLNVTGAGAELLQRELVNDGTVNYSGVSTLTVSGPGKITNNAGFNLTADGDINVSGGATIENSGTLTKSGGSGTSTLFPPVNSTGTVSATSGTFALAGGGTPYTNLAATAPAIIAFPAGSHTLLGNFAGTGTIRFSGAAVTLGSPFSIPVLSVTGGTATLNANGSAGTFTMTGGVLAGSGTLTLTNGGTWSGGTWTGATAVNPAAMTLSITAPVTLDGTLQNGGTLSVGGNVTGSGAIDNQGTIDVAGSATIGVAVNNNGQLATSGSLSLSLGGTHTGTFTVTAPGNLSFSAGTHTVTGGGSIGGTGTLTFNGATATVDVPIAVGTLSVTAGTATLDAAASADAFSMSGGTIGGSGTLTLTNGGTWSDGTMSGSGTTAVPATKTLNISGDVTLSRTLQNAGTLSMNGDVSGSGTIANTGTVNAAATSTINAPLNNSGQVTATALLSLAGDGTHTGTFTATSPGSIAFPSGTHTMTGASMTGTGTFAFNGAAVTFGSPFSIANLSVTAGTATFDSNGSIDVLDLTGGTLAGSGTLTLTNGGTWSDGTMSGSGTTAIPATKTLNISGDVTLSRTLQNGGTLSMNGDVAGTGTIANTGTLSATGTSTINAPLNNSGQVTATALLSLAGDGTHTGTFTATSPGSIAFPSGTHTMSGASMTGTGTFAFNGAAVTFGSPFSIANLSVTNGTATFDANGSIDVLDLAGGTLGGTGTLTLTNGGTWADGTMGGSGTTAIPATGTLNITGAVTLSRTLENAGTLSMTGDVSGTGTIANNGTLDAVEPSTINAPLNNSGQVTASALLSLAGDGTHTGTFTATAPGSIAFPSGTHTMTGASMTGTGTFDVSGAAVTFNSAYTIGNLSVTAGTASFDSNGSVDVLDLTGGTLGGTGTLTLTNGGSWSEGTMSGSGTTAVPAAKTLEIDDAVTLTSRTLQIDGTLSLNGYVEGSGTIANNGTLSAIGSSAIGTALNNGGQVTASALLSLAGDGTHTGTFTATAPGSIDFPSGTHTMSGGTSMTGTGTFAFDGAVVAIGGPFTIGNLSVTAGTATLDANGSVDVLTMNGGTLGGTGTLTLTNGGTWSDGTMNGSGTTAIPATKTLGISGAVTLNRTLQNAGTLSMNGDVTGIGTIANSGTLSATGTSTITSPLNNSGQVTASALLSLAGDGTHTGTFIATSPGSIAFPSGTHTMSAGTSMTGTGTFALSGAAVAIGGPFTIGNLSVTAGAATLDANGSIDVLTMTGGTLGGTGALTLTNGGTWSGGTMSGSGTTILPATKTLSIPSAVTLSSRTLQNNGTLSVGGNVAGSGTIDNQGTLTAAGTLTIAAAVNNSGQLTTGGVLSLTGSGTHTGTFTVTSPGNLSFASGAHTMSGGGSIGGTGTLTFSGATATVGVPVNAGALNVTAGTATLNASSAAGGFTMTGGTLGGSGLLTLTNGGSWSGGTMTGSGTTILPATKTLSISAPVTLDSRTLQNDGTLSLSSSVTGSGAIANNGSLQAFSNSSVGVALNNSGQVTTGALLSLGGSGTHSGTFTSTAPGVIDFSGGTQTISGPLAGTGTFRFGGAAATVNGAWSGLTIEVAGGSAAFNTNGTIPALTLSGGTLGGSGDVTVTGPSTWSGGTIAGSGGFTVDTGATVAMPGTNAVTLARELMNRGTINYSAVSNGMLIAGVALRNHGLINIQSSQAITTTPGTPSFINAGSLRKLGIGSVQVGAPLANSGQVRVDSGTLHFGSAYTQTAGTTNILDGAALRVGTLSLNGGILTGNGRVVGAVTNRATVTPGASPGTLTIDGDYVQSSSGELNIELRGTAPGTQYDRLLVSGSVTLGGTLDVVTPGGFIPAPGDAFRILTFGSRVNNSNFAVMNGLTIAGTALQPSFSATDLKLMAGQLVLSDVAVGVSGPLATIAGSRAVYAITVSNSGPDPATGVTVTATASSGLTFDGNSGACSGSFPCSLTLGPGQSATILSAWDIAPTATGDVRLTVTAVAGADANPSNNSATATTRIGACPIITIIAPDQMIAGETAQASATPFSGAAYNWTLDGGVIESGQGTPGISFTAGEPGTLRLVVNVIGGGCTLSAPFDVTVKPPPGCDGTATPIAPAGGTTTADGVVAFSWNVVEGASGYRLWLQQGDAPARYVGTTLEPSRTRILPPGAYRWFVETLFDGCASHESERLALTILPASDCATREAPQLSAPANDVSVTSAAVAFSWNAVPKALEYELWLAPLGGVPTLIQTTSETSYTAVVPPGRLEWYVRAIHNGCAATESARRAFTYVPPPECTSERPLLIAPAEREKLTSPVSFEWTGVSGATSYELYVDGVLAATTTSPQASGIAVALGEHRWQVRAHLAAGCGAVDSAENRLVILPQTASCAPLGAPGLIVPGQISSGTPGRIQWSFVPGASAYVVEISGDPRFPRDETSSSTVVARQLPFNFTNAGNAPAVRYVRVRAIDTNCVQLRTGAFSEVGQLSVLPRGGKGTALLTDPTEVEYTLTIAAEFAGQRFTATPSVPWLTVTPASGIVPEGGQTLRAVANTAGLPPGTSTGSVEMSTSEVSGTVTTNGTLPPVKVTIPINNIPGVSTSPKSTPPPDALIIPAVANVTSVVVRYDSDISVTNTSTQVIKYEINFVPSGSTGLSEGQKTTVSLEPGATMAMTDIVSTWFGGRSSTGTLEIRPLTEIDNSTSAAPVGGLANRTTFASSRTFSTTSTGGTYGQYVPAVPYVNFIGKGSTLSLQHIAQSDQYRTNLGLVEGSGEKVSLEVRIFDAAGAKRAAFNVDLNGGERAQLNGVLAEHGLALDDGRIEVEVVSGEGRVTAYASVVDSITNDPQLVPPVLLDRAGHGKWVVPGVADLAASSGNWQTDVRIFNAGTEPADLTLAFYSMNGGPPTTRTLALAAGEVRQLDRVLSLFGITGDAGALHLSSAVPAPIVTTARTYRQTAEGAYGQFIAAVTPEEAVVVGSRPLQLLQMEQSERFKSNIGFAEVTGKPVTLEVAVFRPNSNQPALLEVKLEPNQFQQLSSLLTSLGLGDVFNARISVRAVSGEGRALAYGSLIDQKTGDPTYIPGQ